MENTTRGLKKELKEQKEYIERKAKERYENHKQSFENWQEGSIEKIWIDEEGNICIQYESGKWWHYNEEGEWW